MKKFARYLGLLVVALFLAKSSSTFAMVNTQDARETVVSLGELHKGDPLAVNCQIDQVIKKVEQDSEDEKASGQGRVGSAK